MLISNHTIKEKSNRLEEIANWCAFLLGFGILRLFRMKEGQERAYIKFCQLSRGGVKAPSNALERSSANLGSAAGDACRSNVSSDSVPPHLLLCCMIDEVDCSVGGPAGCGSLDGRRQVVGPNTAKTTPTAESRHNRQMNQDHLLTSASCFELV